MPQTTFQVGFLDREGALAEGYYDCESRAAEGNLKYGVLLDYGTDPETQVQAMPALPAADPDAIMTAAQFASNVAGASYGDVAAEFDGAIGHDRISPCRTVTVTFAALNINDWNTPAGECLVEIYGKDAHGNDIKDSVSRPNGAAGPATYTTRLAFSEVYLIDVPATAGAGGTGTVGVSNDRVTLDPRDYPGIAVYNPATEPFAVATEVEDHDSVSVLREGKFVAIPEAAVSHGDSVYVRVVAGGGGLVRGRFTGQDGAAAPGTYAQLAGASWRSAAAGAGFAIVELTR